VLRVRLLLASSVLSIVSGQIPMPTCSSWYPSLSSPGCPFKTTGCIQPTAPPFNHGSTPTAFWKPMCGT
jgi:hypothetical protein